MGAGDPGPSSTRGIGVVSMDEPNRWNEVSQAVSEMTLALSRLTPQLARTQASIERAGLADNRERRQVPSASSSDEMYSGGDGPDELDIGGEGLPPLARAAFRPPVRPLRRGSRRVAPPKIVPDDDTIATILDCESYALSNKDVQFDRASAHGLGRLKKDVLSSFGNRAEWTGEPPLQVFDFLNRFVKACDDNSVSEGRALYLLPEFTAGDLRRELLSLLPSSAKGREGEVSSYLGLVNWLLRSYADEISLSEKVLEFNAATQEEGEEETQFYARLRRLNAECGYIFGQGPLKGRFLQGLSWEIQTAVREHNRRDLPVEDLVAYAQRIGKTVPLVPEEGEDSNDSETESGKDVPSSVKSCSENE
ncbi:hypothetical protein MMPV_008762 [Pyropia vietnamensis]